MPTLGPPGLAWLLGDLQPHQRSRLTTAATRSHRQHGEPLQLGQGQVGVTLASEAEAAIPQPPELGIEAVIRAQSVQGEGRAHQLLVGSGNAGPVAVEVGQQTALGIGNGDAPHRSLASHGGKNPLLQRRTAQLSLQLGQADRWGQGRKGR